jgi:hypothetical protein
MNTLWLSGQEKPQRRLRSWFLFLFNAFRNLILFFFSEIVGEYGQRPLYRMLGYFSIIGLSRVHVHLGDFTLALKVLQNIELNQKVR